MKDSSTLPIICVYWYCQKSI